MDELMDPNMFVLIGLVTLVVWFLFYWRVSLTGLWNDLNGNLNLGGAQAFQVDLGASRRHWTLSVVAMAAAQFALLMIPEKSRHPVLQALPVEVFAGVYMRLLTHSVRGSDVLLYTFFLGLWSMVGFTIFLEQTIARNSANILATVIVTVFTAMAHVVELPPFHEVHPSTLRHVAKVKVLFVLQYFAVALMFSFVLLDLLPESTHEVLHGLRHDVNLLLKHFNIPAPG